MLFVYKLNCQDLHQPRLIQKNIAGYKTLCYMYYQHQTSEWKRGREKEMHIYLQAYRFRSTDNEAGAARLLCSSPAYTLMNESLYNFYLSYCLVIKLHECFLWLNQEKLKDNSSSLVNLEPLMLRELNVLLLTKGFRIRWTRVQIPTVPLTSCATSANNLTVTLSSLSLSLKQEWNHLKQWLAYS